MYQLKFIAGRKIIAGYEILVVGLGAKGLCHVQDQHGVRKFSGMCAECEKWLTDRNMTVNAHPQGGQR